MADYISKTMLLNSYCLSLYGCELWCLDHSAIENVCTSWRAGLRHARCLLYRCL